jgi:hypothetical protein
VLHSSSESSAPGAGPDAGPEIELTCVLSGGPSLTRLAEDLQTAGLPPDRAAVLTRHGLLRLPPPRAALWAHAAGSAAMGAAVAFAAALLVLGAVLGLQGAGAGVRDSQQAPPEQRALLALDAAHLIALYGGTALGALAGAAYSAISRRRGGADERPPPDRCDVAVVVLVGTAEEARAARAVLSAYGAARLAVLERLPDGPPARRAQLIAALAAPAARATGRKR